jgi:hypothetical protein
VIPFTATLGSKEVPAPELLEVWLATVQELTISAGPWAKEPNDQLMARELAKHHQHQDVIASLLTLDLWPLFLGGTHHRLLSW